MKKIIILLLILGSKAMAQMPSDSARLIHSYMSAIYADKHMGQKIGKGICSELVVAAIKESSPKTCEEFFSNMDKYEIDSSDISVGDIVVFDSLKYIKGDRIYSMNNHIAIIMQWGEYGFYFAEQNAGHGEKILVKNDLGKYGYVYKDSKVILDYINHKSIVTGKMRFYRF